MDLVNFGHKNELRWPKEEGAKPILASNQMVAKIDQSSQNLDLLASVQN